MDDFRPQAVGVGPALQIYDDEEREDMAKRETLRMVGVQLEKAVKKSPLATTYEYAAKAANRSKNLLTFSETSESADTQTRVSGPSTELSPRKKVVSFGFDALRAFSPTLSIGQNARVVGDVRRGDYLVEWHYGF